MTSHAYRPNCPLSFIPLNFPHTVDVYFDMAGNGGGSGYSYDVAFSMLLGAQINSPRFGSTGEFKAFGPWEQANGAAFYPGTYVLHCVVLHCDTLHDSTVIILLCAAQAPPRVRMVNSRSQKHLGMPICCLSAFQQTQLTHVCTHAWVVHTCRGVLAAVGTITGQPRIVNRDGSLRGVRDGGYDQRHCWACRLVLVATVAKL